MIYYYFPRKAVLLREMGVTDRSPTNVTSLMGGGEVRRTFYESPIRAYSIYTRIRDQEARFELQKLIRDMRGRLNPMTLVSPLAEYNSDVLCGYSDGSRVGYTLFGRDIVEGTVAINFGGEIVTDPEIFPGNCVDDNQAAAVENLSGILPLGADNVEKVTGVARVGLHSFSASIAAPGNEWGLKTGSVGYKAIVATWTLTARASVKCSDPVTVRVESDQIDSTGAVIRTAVGDEVQLEPGVWADAGVTYAADWRSHSVNVKVIVTSGATDRIFVDCIGVSRGDSLDWWLPSQAPSRIIKTGVPDGAPVLATFVGRRVSHARFDSDDPSRSVNTIGDDSFTMNLVEVLGE